MLSPSSSGAQSTPSPSSSPRPQSLATSRQPSGAGVSGLDLTDSGCAYIALHGQPRTDYPGT